MRLKPAVLLDRDGVINLDREDYVKSWEDFDFSPGALGSLRRLKDSGLEVYIITNQACVGWGLCTLGVVRDIHLRLQIAVRRAGGMIHGIVICPHHPDDNCLCRKPAAGMLRIAAVKYGLDLSRSFFVGDAWRDVKAGQEAGCRTIFVRTHADQPLQLEKLAELPHPADSSADNLAEAVEIILHGDVAQARKPA